MNRDGILKQLFSAYPNSQADEGTIAVYVRLLQDIPDGELQTVIDQCIADLKFLPTVAEIRERHFRLTCNLPHAADAWGAVVQEIQRVGSWGLPEFEDALTAQAVAIMGWDNLCQADKLAVERAHFLKIYGELLTRAEANMKLLPQAKVMLRQYTGIDADGVKTLPKPHQFSDFAPRRAMLEDGAQLPHDERHERLRQLKRYKDRGENY